MASRAILSNFFEKQWTHNNPQYLSGYSRALFPTTFPEIAVYAALCTDPTLACVSRRFVRLLFHLPKNKATAGEKAASQVGWSRHRKWFSPHVAVVTPLHNEILNSLLSGPWTKSFQAFSVNAFRWRIRDENRDLKIRRRRRQRELQKNNRLRLAKQQLCTCITLFCTFLYRHCTTTTRKCLISRFMEDVNKLLWNFLSHSELGYGFSGIQLQKCSPTFDKVIELELSRWRLNEREFTF